MIPAVPVLVLGVAVSPIVAGVFVLGLPFFLPLLILGLFLGGGAAALAGGAYASTRGVRRRIEKAIRGVAGVEQLRTSGLYNEFVYQVSRGVGGEQGRRFREHIIYAITCNNSKRYD